VCYFTHQYELHEQLLSMNKKWLYRTGTPHYFAAHDSLFETLAAHDLFETLAAMTGRTICAHEYLGCMHNINTIETKHKDFYCTQNTNM
jgi:hypothetical protein